MAAAGTSELSAAPAGSTESRQTFPWLDVANGTIVARPTKKESTEKTLERALLYRGGCSTTAEILIFSKHVTQSPCVLLSPTGWDSNSNRELCSLE